MKLDDRLQAIAERCGKASQGPYSGMLRAWIAGEAFPSDVSKADLMFLGNSKNDIQLLLSLVKELREALDTISYAYPEKPIGEYQPFAGVESRKALARAEGMAGE